MSILGIIKKIPHVLWFQSRKLEYDLSHAVDGTWFDSVRYRQMFGKRMDWKNPQGMHEKLLWLNRYWQPQLKVNCADKLRVRDYAASCGLGDICVPVLGVWKDPEEIDFEKLPEQFVLKTNHGCGTNIICKDKSELDIEKARTQLAKWLKIDYGKLYNEKHYSRIERCIIAEEYLPALGLWQTDYKLQCINGNVYSILICADRDDSGHAKLFSYDTEWNRIDLLNGEAETMDREFQKPQNLSRMIESARILSKPFPYVRVDFYEVDGKLYLGELTFTPYGNLMTYYKDSVIADMGSKLVLPEKTKL